MIWEVASYYKNDINEKYNIIPLNKRIQKKRIKRRKIIQKNKNGKIIKIWKNINEIYKKMGIYVSMSYKKQNEFIFEYKYDNL